MAISRRKILEGHFPSLRNAAYEITSVPAIGYNCIAWAAEEDTLWWEPDPALIYYWPPGVPREYTEQAYVKAFETLGYTICADGSLQADHQKVAIYSKSGIPQHAARQLFDGSWTSKCGGLDDISHDLSQLEGDLYGHVSVLLSRPVSE